MREIKFRVWDEDNKKMNYHPVLVTFPIENLVYRDTLRRDLMQYTGLKDKNGREIYEGDIIKGVFYMYDCQDTVVEAHFVDGEVIFDTGMFTCQDADFDLYLYDVEVIGNKYKNKE